MTDLQYMYRTIKHDDDKVLTMLFMYVKIYEVQENVKYTNLEVCVIY